MGTKRFQRTKEDFVCEHCGQEVKGNGYTNHCPECLWSKHVDVNPGDRQAHCGGMMEPVNAEMKKGKYRILHCCVRCGFTRKNNTVGSDNFETILEASHNHKS
ncbi:MAG: RNHCP domain-containing protein [Patescibacteria group bacterium]